MSDHAASCSQDPARPADVEGWRRRCERLERKLRVVTAQREVLAAVLKAVLEGATPDMVAAVEVRIAEGAGRDATGTRNTGVTVPPG